MVFRVFKLKLKLKLKLSPCITVTSYINVRI
jgi:hypothetical protein